jgi:hypothetical protein
VIRRTLTKIVFAQKIEESLDIDFYSETKINQRFKKSQKSTISNAKITMENS